MSNQMSNHLIKRLGENKVLSFERTSNQIYKQMNNLLMLEEALRTTKFEKIFDHQ
jgi:hypothetical protein